MSHSAALYNIADKHVGFYGLLVLWMVRIIKQYKGKARPGKETIQIAIIKKLE